MKREQTPQYEVAIVGGGPAGLSAGVWLGRYLRGTVLIDAGDPRNWETRKINGFLGHQGITPAELRGRGRDDCRRFGVKLIDDEVQRATRTAEERFELSLASGDTITAARLLLAFGLRDVWPEVPGLEQCYGETVHVCPDCDGYEARDRKTIVLGNGRRAVQMALALTTWTREIIICTNGEQPDIDDELCAKLDALSIPVLSPAIRRMRSQGGEVHTLELADDSQLDCERVFFSIGQFPADDLGTQLGCKRTNSGLLKVDHRGETWVRNVYAAGDITIEPQLAISAAASGTVAALAIHKSLLPDLLRKD
jgi:thioredoxin reductase